MPEILTEDTVESLDQTIKELQAKRTQLEAKELGEAVEMVELPLADVDLLVGGKNTVSLKNVTPGELLLLVADHHRKAGRMPVDRITLHQQKQQFDPRALRASLLSKYGAKKVMALFPGAIPVFPKSFRAAMQGGIETALPEERMMDFDVTAK